MNPLGIDVVDGIPTAHEAEQKILSVVKQKHRQDMKAKDIADDLNQLGFRNRRGNEFSRQNVEHYIRTYL